MMVLHVEPRAYDAQTLVGKPTFWAGLLHKAQTLVASHAAIPDKIHYVADLRRWVLIQMTCALYFENQIDSNRPRLSPKSLLDAVANTGLASRNTVQAFLREAAKVQILQHADSSKLRQHAPDLSSGFISLMQLYAVMHLQALDTIDGGNRSAVLDDDPALLFVLQPAFARRICARPLWYDPPENIACFTKSNSGSSILHNLILATKDSKADSADRFWVGPLSAGQLSENFKVSSAHVARILSKARMIGAIGWEKPRQGGQCWVSKLLTDNYAMWQAEKLAAMSAAFQDCQISSRVRIHNQNMTTAANAHADRKTLGHLS